MLPWKTNSEQDRQEPAPTRPALRWGEGVGHCGVNHWARDRPLPERAAQRRIPLKGVEGGRALWRVRHPGPATACGQGQDTGGGAGRGLGEEHLAALNCWDQASLYQPRGCLVLWDAFPRQEPPGSTPPPS